MFLGYDTPGISFLLVVRVILGIGLLGTLAFIESLNHFCVRPNSVEFENRILLGGKEGVVCISLDMLAKGRILYSRSTSCIIT
jgi:hypothetical protein